MAKMDYIEKVRMYKSYLEGRIKGYKEISEEESLSGSISADGKISVLEDCLSQLQDIFPELK